MTNRPISSTEGAAGADRAPDLRHVTDRMARAREERAGPGSVGTGATDPCRAMTRRHPRSRRRRHVPRGVMEEAKPLLSRLFVTKAA